MNEKQVVKKDNALIESRCNLTLNQQKLVLAIVAQIKREDEDFKEYFISVKDFKELMDLKSAGFYTEMRQAAKDIRSKDLIIPREGGRELITGWFSSIEIGHEGEVGFMFDVKLKPYLLQLQSRFTAYQLKNILSLKSKYSIRVYELLKQYESLKCRRFDLVKLRELLFVEPGIYPNFNNFKLRILEPAKKDINQHTDISISYSTVKTGRKVTGIEFCIVSQGPGKKIKSIPSKILNMIPESERTACMDNAQAVFNEHGEDGLIFYLEKCNAKKKTANGNYGGYLNTLVELDLWPVEKRTREIQAGGEKVKAQMERGARIAADKARVMEDERKTQEEADQKMLQDLVNFVDLEALDAFIQGQELNDVQARLFKQGKRNILRKDHVKSFITKGSK